MARACTALDPMLLSGVSGLSSTVGCRDCRDCRDCRGVLDSARTWWLSRNILFAVGAVGLLSGLSGVGAVGTVERLSGSCRVRVSECRARAQGLTADLADRPTPPTPPTAETQYRNGRNFVTPQVSSPTADHPREIRPQPKWGNSTDEPPTPVCPCYPFLEILLEICEDVRT